MQCGTAEGSVSAVQNEALPSDEMQYLLIFLENTFSRASNLVSLTFLLKIPDLCEAS